MTEHRTLRAVRAALHSQGIEDTLVAAGQFSPRGVTGAMFAGGLAGSGVGGWFGGAASTVGMTAGVLAGSGAAASRQQLPRYLRVGVSEQWVYGVSRDAPAQLLFRLPREGLQVAVRQRVNVRILELVAPDSGTRVALEGNRLPITHSKDVIDALQSG